MNNKLTRHRNMPKLTKQQSKRFDEWIGGFAEADIIAKEYLADELSRQREEIVEDLEKMNREHFKKHPEMIYAPYNKALDHAIQTIKGGD
jgi:hypothetical protein